MKHCMVCGKEIEHGIKMGKRIKCLECAFEPFGSIMGEKLKEKMEEDKIKNNVFKPSWSDCDITEY